MKPIYVPSGKAKEYGDYAINIYTGCPHGCYYCFAPSVLRKDRELFHIDVCPRNGIVEAVGKQLRSGDYGGKLIHLCFTCDPYPSGIDTTPTTNIIKLIKAYGANVQILTKNPLRATKDIGLLGDGDWFGTTLTGAVPYLEPNCECTADRILGLYRAKSSGIHTWVSFEPVIDPIAVLQYISNNSDLMDKVKIGKLNYHPSAINWHDFGHSVEALCKKQGLNYYIKESLQKEMLQ